MLVVVVVVVVIRSKVGLDGATSSATEMSRSGALAYLRLSCGCMLEHWMVCVDGGERASAAMLLLGTCVRRVGTE